MKKSELKAIIREEIRQIREYGSIDPAVDRRIQRNENDIRELKAADDRIRGMYGNDILKLNTRVKTIEANLEIIAKVIKKELGVKLKR